MYIIYSYENLRSAVIIFVRCDSSVSNSSFKLLSKAIAVMRF